VVVAPSFYIKDVMGPIVTGDERAVEQLSVSVYVLSLSNCTSGNFRWWGRCGRRIPYISAPFCIPSLNSHEYSEC